MRSYRLLALVAASVASLLVMPAAEADHSWGNYHWARTSAEVTLDVGNNVSSTWEPFLDEAISDWNPSAVLDLTKVTGGTASKRCRPTAGRIEVCSDRYGRNGWLGLAQIWASGGHITQAVAKMNDTYFGRAPYNSPAWRRLVMCQEIAHDFGLDHQDEVFGNPNLGSCMDYTNNPVGNEHPNDHDFEQLATIYAHLDGAASQTTSRNGTGEARSEAAGGNSTADWGTAIDTDGEGRPDLFVRELPSGQRLFTHVFWAT